MAENTKPDINSFKPNSYISKAEAAKQPEERKAEKVIKGKILSSREPSAAKKLFNLFFDTNVESVQEIKDYVLRDLIIKNIKDTIFDIFAAFWKGESSPSVKKTNFTNYSSKYKIVGENSKLSARSDRRSIRNFREIVFETRADAEAVRNDLLDYIREYQRASILTYYDMIGEGAEGTFADDKYGWVNPEEVMRAPIKRALGGGWILYLPPATPLD